MNGFAWADAIIERIEYGGETVATLDTLMQLQRAFILSVPFENLDIHLGRKIILDRDRVLKKVVEDRRGGWCFELNEVFLVLLQELGFRVERCAASVLLNGGDAGELHAFDHLTLVAQLEGVRWLLDVGFGDSCLRPLNLDEKQRQGDGRASYRVVPQGRCFRVECESRPEDWKPYHQVDPQPRQWHEFEQRCEFLQTSRKSKFTAKRLCTRIVGNISVTLSGNALSIGDARETVPEHRYFDVLREHFDIELGDVEWIQPT